MRQHLVERCSFPRSLYKNVTNEPKYQPLVESFKQTMGASKKKSLRESVNPDALRKTLRESTLLKESELDPSVADSIVQDLMSQGLDVDFQLWQFPVSKINTKEEPNLNGRVYGLDLWKNVIEKQKDIWKGGTGLANHPADDDDGDFMLQSIVWLDAFIDEEAGIVYGIGSFVGLGGELALQIIARGGRIGFSSSGYGDFLADGITVDPNDYEIERLADLVLNPSQGVYGDHKDLVYKRESKENNNMKTKVTESTKKPLNESVFKITFDDDSTKEFESFDDVKDVLKDKLKNKDDADDFEEIDVGEFEDHYVGEESEKFDGVKSVEIPEDAYGTDDDEEVEEDSDDDDAPKDKGQKLEEGDPEDDEGDDDSDDEEEEESEEEETTLSEQLLVDHYNEAVKTIGQKSNKLWEEKINELESLIAKLKKESLGVKSKKTLNETIQNTIDSIMKDTSKAIQEGFEARELCEELEISNLSKLHGIKEKIEDFGALEECLNKATKEAEKYKALYEDKVNSMTEEAKENYIQENEIKELKSKNKGLQESVKNFKDVESTLNEKLRKAHLSAISTGKKNVELHESLDKATTRVNNLRSKLNEMSESLKTANHDRILAERAKNDVIAKNRKLREQNEQLQSLLEEADKTIEQLSSKVRVSGAKQKVSEARLDHMNRARKIAERNERRALHTIDGATLHGDNLFKESDEISTFLDKIEGNAELKESIGNSKTLREAQNKYLFSNDLLSEEAEIERESINNNRGDAPESLAEMFR